MSVEIGKTYRTPWEPSGLFRVTAIIPACGVLAEMATGVFVDDHPAGYEADSPGRYYTHELEGRLPTEEAIDCAEDNAPE